LPHLGRRVEETRAAAPAPAASAGVADVTLVREGDVWAVGSGGRTIRIVHARGVEMLATLLASPGRDFHVLDLAGAERPVDAGDAGPLLDEAAQRAYRRRIAELDEDLVEADAWNDAGRRRRAVAEREFLAAELARGIGLGGRGRRAAGAVERA